MFRCDTVGNRLVQECWTFQNKIVEQKQVNQVLIAAHMRFEGNKWGMVSTGFIYEIKITVTIILPPDRQDGGGHDEGCWTDKAVRFTEGERFIGDE